MLQSSVIIVIINSLASIAKKRPAIYGWILSVLLGIDLNCESGKEGRVASVQHVLKTAFFAFLKWTQPGAMAWRDRLLAALQA